MPVSYTFLHRQTIFNAGQVSIQIDEEKIGSSAFNQRRFRAFPKKLERALSEGHNFAFAILALFVVGLDLLVRDRLDHLNNILGFGHKIDQLGVIGFYQLQ
jgi:hypothetical protein